MTYFIRPYRSSDMERLESIEKDYQRLCPDATESWLPAYRENPVFSVWDTIICLVDGKDRVFGFGHIYPLPAQEQNQDHQLYLFMKLDPVLSNKKKYYNILYNQLTKKAAEIKQQLPPGEIRLYAQYFSSETTILPYFYEQGYEVFREHDLKSRDLTHDFPEFVKDPRIKPWLPKTPFEKLQYVQAKQSAFPDVLTSLEQLEFQMRSPYWLLIAAWDESQELLGSIMLLQPPWEKEVVFTEDLFVNPAYQEKGLGNALLLYALKHAKEAGFKRAEATIHTKNIAAQAVTKSLGYQVLKKEVFLRKPF